MGAGVKTETSATIHYCDGCGKGHVQLKDEDMPNGFYLQVFENADWGADAGDLFTCSKKCIAKAIERRHEVWHPER